ncbi:hypothetical protein MMC09_002844 [Bachmanniomyces sp. S44760]|nr:hypothetical protein [Bachmanniomyces sp. S44760]
MSTTVPTSSSDSTTFTLASRSLKLNTSEETAPHFTPLGQKASSSAIKTIETINLSGNTFSPSACATIADILLSSPHLDSIETAILSDIFTSRLLSEIPPALDSLLTALLSAPTLHTIDLSDNAFGLNTVEPLVKFLPKCVGLKVLRLNNNGLGPQAGTMVANALSELAELKKASKAAPLEVIICGRNRLESGSMQAWAKAFSSNSGVKEVRMVQNGIRQEGILTLISEGLAKCTDLQILDLEDNTFGNPGGNALATSLPHWKELRELALGDCYLGRQGGRVLTKALSKGSNKSLKTLKLPFNNLNNSNVIDLFQATKTNLPVLKRLELNGNQFSEDDEVVIDFRELFQSRREAAATAPEEEEEDRKEEKEEYGLDELDELESDEEEEEEEGSDEDQGDEDEEEEEDEEEKEARQESILHDANDEENELVAQKDDPDVDALAERIGKTEL